SDAIQPGADRRPLLEAGEAEPGRQQSLLHRVLGVLQRTEHAVAVQLQLAPVGLDQRRKRLSVALPRPMEQIRRHLATSVAHPFSVPTPAASGTGRSRYAQFRARVASTCTQRSYG